MDYLRKIIIDFELQSVSGIKECFENGISPNDFSNGKPLIYELINMYPRGPIFKECVKLFVEYGLEFEDKVLLAVLCDDGASLHDQLNKNVELLKKEIFF